MYVSIAKSNIIFYLQIPKIKVERKCHVILSVVLVKCKGIIWQAFLEKLVIFLKHIKTQQRPPPTRVSSGLYYYLFAFFALLLQNLIYYASIKSFPCWASLVSLLVNSKMIDTCSLEEWSVVIYFTLNDFYDFLQTDGLKTPYLWDNLNC